MYSDPEKIGYFTSEYYAMVKEVDDWVGKIPDYLKMPVHPSDGYSMRGLIGGTDEVNGTYVVTEWLSELKTSPAHMVI